MVRTLHDLKRLSVDDMKKDDLIKYRAFANALIRLNNATTSLLNEGADPEAIKLILKGTAQLYAELESNMQSHGEEDPEALSLGSEDLDKDLPLDFSSSGTFPLSPEEQNASVQNDERKLPKATPPPSQESPSERPEA